MVRKYDDSVKQEAVEAYLNGYPAAQVAKIIGANEATVRKWLKDEGVTIKSGGIHSLKHDDKTVNSIKELYSQGMNTPEIERELNLKRGVPSYLLRKNNVQLNHRGPKSKIVHEDFFDVIDTEEKAYYLGWLMADGNVSITDGQYSLKIHLALRDKELIDKFLSVINSTNKSKVKEGKNPSYYVSLTSVHMCKALMKLGVVPRKSGLETFPEEVPNGLRHHFIRGVFDGDGIVSVASKRSGFVGSKNIITNVLKSLGENKLTIFDNKKNENICYFLGGKKFSKRLYNYLYEDAAVWLSRKRQNLEKICFE